MPRHAPPLPPSPPPPQRAKGADAPAAGHGTAGVDTNTLGTAGAGAGRIEQLKVSAVDDAKNVGMAAGGKDGDEDDDDDWGDDPFDDFQSAPPAPVVVDAASAVGSGADAFTDTSATAKPAFVASSAAGSQPVKPPETDGPAWNLDFFMGGSVSPAAGAPPARVPEGRTEGLGGLLGDDGGASAGEGKKRHARPMDLIR